MVEGAIAHYQATGSRKFLDIAIRYADCVCREIGDGADQLIRVPGHQIAEMALAKLYLVTGDQKYLDQAKFWISAVILPEKTNTVRPTNRLSNRMRRSDMLSGRLICMQAWPMWRR